MKKKGNRLVLVKLLQKIAPKIGAKVLLEPEWGIAGQIAYKSGRKRYFRYSTLDLNRMGASEIARDKDFANFFMKRMGYPTIPGKTFFTDHWAEVIGSKRTMDAGYQYARKLGFPVIVKPNSRSQGVGVALAYDKKEFYRAMNAAFKEDNVVLVQRPVYGKDYRLVVLDNEIVSAYQRIPLSVTGDGKSSINKLLIEKQRRFKKEGRDTLLKLNDPRMALKLKHQGLNMRSVPAKRETIYLLDNANLSTGGDSIDMTKYVHLGFQKIAISLTKGMGLRLCGVDLMIDGDISTKPGRYWVIEVNSAPGLDHYFKIGRAQEKIVEGLYLRV